MSKTISGQAWPGARRVLGVFYLLNTSRVPLPTSRFINDAEIGYNLDKGEETRKTAFARDRRTLESCGIHVVEVTPESAEEHEESTWAIDRKRTYVGSLKRLSTTSLERLFRELQTHRQNPLWAANSAFTQLQAMLAGELSRRGDSSFLAGYQELEPIDPDPDILLLWNLYSRHHVADVTYERADGTVRERPLETLGFFLLNGRTYFVAHEPGTESPKSYLIDRVHRVREGSGTYRIPEGFRVQDYLFLPFDFPGQDAQQADATFSFPVGTTSHAIDTITRSRGTIDRGDDVLLWHIEVEDVQKAAAYALEHVDDGMRPVGPQSLVEAWRCQIERAVEAHG